MEWAVTERRRLREFHAKVPMLSQYDELKPWNSVLLAAFRGTASLTYWKAKVDLRVKEFEEATSHRGKGIQADVLQLQGGGALGPDIVAWTLANIVEERKRARRHT